MSRIKAYAEYLADLGVDIWMSVNPNRYRPTDESWGSRKRRKRRKKENNSQKSVEKC